MKILLIDDDPVALALCRAVLEKRDYDVITLESTLGASAVILREEPRVVVLDIEMPCLSGDDWLQMLRERKLLGEDNRTAFIFHSGVDVAELERISRETGALGSIPKQGNPLAFADAFERLVEALPT
ncbi:MAG TPA: response regulator [Myxococcota bacterium]